MNTNGDMSFLYSYAVTSYCDNECKSQAENKLNQFAIRFKGQMLPGPPEKNYNFTVHKDGHPIF